MSRRSTLVRQQSLDARRQKDGMRVLEAYCRKRYYRNSELVLCSGDDNIVSLNASTTTAATTPDPFSSASHDVGFDVGPSARLPSADASGQPASTATFVFDRPARMSSSISLLGSYRRASMKRHTTTQSDYQASSFNNDLLDSPPLEEEIKHKENETQISYVLRIVAILYRRLGIQHVALIVLLIAYSLLGGLFFCWLEGPAEMRLIDELSKLANERHQNFTYKLLSIFVSPDCNYLLKKGLSESNKENVTCKALQQFFLDYDAETGANPFLTTTRWKWDYWNAVFYAGSIFTTIGYGNMACKTIGGRIGTIVYALIGVPLMLVVLDSIGKVLFLSVQIVWEKFRRTFRQSVTLRMKHKLFATTTFSKEDRNRNKTSIAGFGKRPPPEVETLSGVVETAVENEIELVDETDPFETFPMYLALAIVFIYICICAVIFSFWENWDYFTAFYFFFISLSTVGLGDEMPEHPRYACAFFIFFVIGLSLVSMCLTIMQMRVEARYMAALQMIDEDYISAMTTTRPPQLIAVSEKESPNNLNPLQHDGAIRWRHKLQSIDENKLSNGTTRRTNKDEELGESTMRISNSRLPSTSTILSSITTTTVTPPPVSVFGVFLARSMSQQRKMSTDRKLSSSSEPPTTSFRRFQLIMQQAVDELDGQLPSASSDLFPGTMTLPPQAAQPDASLSTVAAAKIASESTHQIGSRLSSAPLSVITEASDEETKEMQRRRISSGIKQKPPARFFLVANEDGEE